MEKKIFLKETKPFLYLYKYNLNLPNILFNERKKEKSPSKISNTNPNINRKIKKYNSIRSILKFPKIESKSPRYYEILNTENIQGLAINSLRSNKNIFNYIKEKSTSKKDNIIDKLNKNSDNTYRIKIKNMIRLHSSKYHPETTKINSLNDEFDKVLRKLKYGYYELNNDVRVMKYRQRMAFKYRFLQNDKNITPLNFKQMNIKMNKLLSISKSIPNYLLQNTKSAQKKKEENNKNYNSINTSINASDTYNKNNRINKLLYKCSTKRTINEENLRKYKKNEIIYSSDQNGRKYLRHLSLLL